MRILQIVIVIAIASLLSCGPKEGSRSASLFPETNEVAGWSKTGEMRTFEAANLWQYIDGDAERYIEAGVQRTLTTDYRYQDKIDAVADIYVMQTAEGARKVFEAESSEGSLEIGLGDAGRLYGQSVTFWKGPYFVRLLAYEDALEIGKALVELARAIEGKLERQR